MGGDGAMNRALFQLYVQTRLAPGRGLFDAQPLAGDPPGAINPARVTILPC